MANTGIIKNVDVDENVCVRERRGVREIILCAIRRVTTNELEDAVFMAMLERALRATGLLNPRC